MGVVKRREWTGEGFLERLPDLLRPRILAEGYQFHSEDEGKQVYIRSKYALKRRLRLMPDLDDLIRSMKLTVGYIRTPRKTTVVFTWESLLSKYKGERTTDWLREQGHVLTQYLDEWFNEVQGEIEST